MLIKWCYDLKASPVIASDPVQSEVESTEIVTTPPHVIDFLSEKNTVEVEELSIDWLKKVPNKFHLAMNEVTT